MLETGIKGTQKITVDSTNTASKYKSGHLDVFATPAMIALMEYTASESVAPFMEEGMDTVGTHIDVSHIKATPIGKEVICTSELIEIDRKRLVFKVKASDETGIIGTGTHERFIINVEKFLSKLN